VQRVALDRTLALYPDGFSAQFRNARGEGGVQFLPVSAFHMSFEVIGMSFENGDWRSVRSSGGSWRSWRRRCAPDSILPDGASPGGSSP